jgi:hypothetical protein
MLLTRPRLWPGWTRADSCSGAIMGNFTPLAFAALAAFGLAGCNTPAPQASAPPAPGSVAVTPPNFQLPEGGNCSAEIARYRAIQGNDLSMGHVAQSVYNQIKREISAAESVCSAGHDAEAKAMIVASKQRHGYPTNL